MARDSKNSERRDSNLSRRRAERRAARGSDNVADWEGVDSALVVRLIGVVTRANGLCSFGYTRDGSTYTVTVILDGDKTTDYCRPSEDISAFLGDLIEDFSDLG